MAREEVTLELLGRQAQRGLPQKARHPGLERIADQSARTL